MKELILKYLEIKKIKYEKLYCKHDLKIEYTCNVYGEKGKVPEKITLLIICKKCGETIIKEIS